MARRRRQTPRAPGGLGSLPGTPRAMTWSSTRTTRRGCRVLRLQVPTPEQGALLRIRTSSHPRTAVRGDWASFQPGHHGLAHLRGDRTALRRRTSTSSISTSTGLGVEMAEALAEYWHRRIREELGFADEDGPNLTGLFRQQYRGGGTRWATLRAPISPTTQRWSSCWAATASGSRCPKASNSIPSQTTDAHHLPPPEGQVLHRLDQGQSPSPAPGAYGARSEGRAARPAPRVVDIGAAATLRCQACSLCLPPVQYNQDDRVRDHRRSRLLLLILTSFSTRARTRR